MIGYLRGLLPWLLIVATVGAALYGLMAGQALEQGRAHRRRHGRPPGPVFGWRAATAVRAAVGWWRAWRQAAGWMKVRR